MKTMWLLGMVLTLTMTMTMTMAMADDAPTCGYTPVSTTTMCTTLPMLKIDTHGKELNPEWPNDKIAVSVSLASGTPSSPAHFASRGDVYEGAGAAKVRGQTSRANPKKSYTLDIDVSTELLGMPKSKKWVLYAPWGDKTMLRNSLNYELTSLQNAGWAPRTRAVELFLNASSGYYDYKGVYLLTEKIRIGKNRVNISKSGGYIIKKDKLHAGEIPPFQVVLPSGVSLLPGQPKGEDLDAAQRHFLTTFLTEWETSLNVSAKDRAASFSRYADLDSFASYFLSTEFFQNQDGFRHSVYFHMDKGGTLHAGPQWDLDVTYINTFNKGSPDGWQYQAWDDVPYWWAYLMETPEFQSLVKSKWNAMVKPGGPWHYSSIATLTNSLVSQYSTPGSLDVVNASARNYARWQVLDEWLWPGIKYRLFPDYYDYVENNVLDWIPDRIAWITQALSKLS